VATPGPIRRLARFTPTILAMTTRTVSIDLIRRDASRHRRDQRDFCRTRSDVTHIDDGLLAGETAARVARALQSLAPEERDAIIRSYYGGSSYCDVALDSGVTEGTIKSRIRRGSHNSAGRSLIWRRWRPELLHEPLIKPRLRNDSTTLGHFQLVAPMSTVTSSDASSPRTR
jgi:hypothetical protein